MQDLNPFDVHEGRALVRGLTALRWGMRLIYLAPVPAFCGFLVFLPWLTAPSSAVPIAVWAAALGLWGMSALAGPLTCFIGLAVLRRARIGSMWLRYLRFAQACALLPIGGAACLLDPDPVYSPIRSVGVAVLVLQCACVGVSLALAELARYLELPDRAAEAGRCCKVFLGIVSLSALFMLLTYVESAGARALVGGGLFLVVALLYPLALLYDLVLHLRWAAAMRYGVPEAQKPGTVSTGTRWFER